MSKAEKTKAYIIEKSALIFNKQGYAGTSLSDLIEATGLTKGSIYGNFANKEEVAIAVYDYNVKALWKKLNDEMNSKQLSKDKLIAFTDFYRNNWKTVFEKGGCPIQNASIEADDNLTFLKKHIQNSIRSWVADISRILENGKDNGEFNSNINPQEYAYTIITLLEGGIMLSKIMNNQKLLFAALDRIVLLIDHELAL
jgi:TetR/AcrR family transcriptional repressor of nem operon